MPNCEHIPAHPRKNEAGVSQNHRLEAAILPASVKIDAHTLADRLMFVASFARQVNYFNLNLQVENWVPFFDTSLPFVMARLIKTDLAALAADLKKYTEQAETQSSAANVRLLQDFVRTDLFKKINADHLVLQQTPDAFTAAWGQQLRTFLRQHLQDLIVLGNTLTRDFSTDFPPADGVWDEFSKNHIWDLDVPADIYAVQISPFTLPEATAQLKNMGDTALQVLQFATEEAPNWLDDSLEPLREEYRQLHPAHLGLLFAFLKMFEDFGQDLNALTQTHLEFYFKNVLQLEARAAEPDHAHLILDIQKHIERHLLKKDTAVKDGKDPKGADVFFKLDEDVVVDKAQIADLRTLHLNPEHVGLQSPIEGLYIAPVAASADGKGKAFSESDLKSWLTLGSKPSKCTLPGSTSPEPHPFARQGFVLSSPVLLLQEGVREITINLECSPSVELFDCLNAFLLDPNNNPFCQPYYWLTEDVLLKMANWTTPVTSKATLATLSQLLARQKPFPLGFGEHALDVFLGTLYPDGGCDEVNTAERKILHDALLLTATFPEKCFLPKGREDIPSIPVTEEAQNFLNNLVDGDPVNRLRFVYLNALNALSDYTIPADEIAIQNVLVGGSIFKVSLSGEKEWIQPDCVATTINFLGNGNLLFQTVIGLPPEVSAVVFPDAEVLLEDFHFEKKFPLVKLELNPEIKIKCTLEGSSSCCLEIQQAPSVERLLSLYEFFKDLKIEDIGIEVRVCGVKNLVVQNDESLQSVKTPILPFGPRPKVGSNFYIGSNEVFGKNWQKAWVNVGWKDRPIDLAAHYQFYAATSTAMQFEDGSSAITAGSFKLKTALLHNFSWLENQYDYPTPPTVPDRINLFLENEQALFCLPFKSSTPHQNSYPFENPFFKNYGYDEFSLTADPTAPLDIKTEDNFLRLTLAGVSFQHDRYPFVLTQQMMALAGVIDIITASDVVQTLNDIVNTDCPALRNRLIALHKLLHDDPFSGVDGVKELISDLQGHLNNVNTELSGIPNVPNALTALGLANGVVTNILGKVNAADTMLAHNPILGTDILDDLQSICDKVNGILIRVNGTISPLAKLGIPLEPYTPTIKEISIDYTAIATESDLLFAHLYPYEQTSKTEDVLQKPYLLAHFEDEGTLFIGVKNLQPGGSLRLLFQLAEATADSESKRADVNWAYLAGGNRWLPLRTGFEIIEDATQELTVSGIVKIAVPTDIAERGHTVLPTDFFWFRVSAPANVSAICQTIGIHTQAVRATFDLRPDNDTTRLAQPLAAQQLAKLANADANVKTVLQPYESFGGKPAETENIFWVRASERLRHKGRAINVFDYERLTLQQFPQIFKAKCIPHDMALPASAYEKDMEWAASFVTVAVIPDLRRMKAGDNLNPRVPLSLLDDIREFLCQRTSPFARLRVTNPRYEAVDLRIDVRFRKGVDLGFHQSQLQLDITHFLAPWWMGDTEKLRFGQPLHHSDLLYFVECLPYVDFVVNLEFLKKNKVTGIYEVLDTKRIEPTTARSILAPGKITVCVDDPDCLDYDRCNKLPDCPPLGIFKPTTRPPIFDESVLT